MKNFGIIGIAFWGAQMSLWGVTHFTLPRAISGWTTGELPSGRGSRINCVRIPVPNTRCTICFPEDGSQPSTTDAGLWSCANATNPAITDWWVRVFGGNQAVNQSRVDASDTLPGPQMGFDAGGVATHIIRVNTTIAGTPVDFEQQFWRTFREIAADPVGRVLLYRLLIEIRRFEIDPPNVIRRGCCEIKIPSDDILNGRNWCRNVQILNNTGDRFAFINYDPDYTGGLIKVDFSKNPTAPILFKNTNDKLITIDDESPYEVALFHEMLHCFHLLRNPVRFTQGGSGDPRVFKYALRCYYGDQNELGVWIGAINNEDIATILGVPNFIDERYHNDIAHHAFFETDPGRSNSAVIHGRTEYVPNKEGFLNGDDLSENVYRISVSYKKVCYMRFGYGYRILPVPALPTIPHRFILANRLAVNCYREIRGTPGDKQIHWGIIKIE